jgi:DNA-binding beta-propeller fold protein YncE
MNCKNIKFIHVILPLLFVGLTACDIIGDKSFKASYSIDVAVSGLIGSVELQLNGGENLLVTTNGMQSFATRFDNGAAYSVTILTQPAYQTCTVSSGSGTISGNSASVSITCTSYSYTISGTVSGLNDSMVLQNNGGDNLAVAGNGPFSFATPVVYGNPYNVTVYSLRYPNQICTISGGSGTVTANVSNVSISCVKNTTPRFAYVANTGDDTVSIYTVNAVTGELGNVGTAATGSGPYSVTVDPSGKFAYVANAYSNDISAFTISATSGSLTQIICSGGVTVCNGSNFLAGSSPYYVTVDTTGQFAYAANSGSNNVSAYKIDRTTGALTAVSASPFAAGFSPYSVSIEPLGKFAFVVNDGVGGSSSLSAYTINATTGALTEVDQNGVAAGKAINAGNYPYDIAIDPTGKYAYVTNSSDANVSAYNINSVTSALSVITGSPFSTGLASFPYAVTVDPSGRYVYVANYNSSSVAQFTIVSDGTLTPMTPATVAAGTNPLAIKVDPSGKFVYVVNTTDKNVYVYDINSTNGKLSPASVPVISTGIAPHSVTISPAAQ